MRERMESFVGAVQEDDIAYREVVITDDGLASGFTMIAAVRACRSADAARIIVTVPTSSAHAADIVEREADEVVCLNIRSGSAFAVADAYRRWHDLTEEEAQVLLVEAEKMGLL
ncbi:MAG: phosphoribosyltransferase family protein [Methanomicrobiales archaeon]|nr:phosphoribosyltransferase family protein [Methanomicrobiales archaeon]